MSRETHLFHTFDTTGVRHVTYYGRDIEGQRLYLQKLMGELGFDSQIIEVDGQFNISEAYVMAKTYAARYGVPVVTDRENLEHMKAVNAKTQEYAKVIKKAIKALKVPADLKESVLNQANDAIEEWRGCRQGEIDSSWPTRKVQTNNNNRSSRGKGDAL